MSAIKKFFEKKKVEAKFKLAGPGQKLGDAQSDAASKAAREAALAAAVNRQGPSTSRAGLTSQQASAASAALNRISASPSEAFDKKRSQAHIRAMAQKELEKERQKDQEIAKIKETYGEKGTVELEGPSMLGCEGVFYKCPLIDETLVLPKAEMKEKIRQFLHAQLESEDKGLAACLMIHTLNKDADKVQVCIATLGKYLDNIVQNPGDEKYRKIRKTNKAFHDRVGSLEGTDIFLSAAGFQPTDIEGQAYWQFPDEALTDSQREGSLSRLAVLKDALFTAEAVTAELDRGLRVLMPSEANRQVKLPPDFFSVSADEIKREQQARTEAVEREGMLRTKAMREREEQREKRKYKFTLIRIRFPDGLVLQGTFSVYERFSAVLEFVQECLEYPLPFVLQEAAGSGGKRFDDEEVATTSLSDLRLVPSAVLTFAWHSSVKEEVEAQLKQSGLDQSAYLKSDLLERAVSS